jgi:hypothetical protein
MADAGVACGRFLTLGREKRAYRTPASLKDKSFLVLFFKKGLLRSSPTLDYPPPKR